MSKKKLWGKNIYEKVIIFFKIENLNTLLGLNKINFEYVKILNTLKYLNVFHAFF